MALKTKISTAADGSDRKTFSYDEIIAQGGVFQPTTNSEYRIVVSGRHVYFVGTTLFEPAAMSWKHYQFYLSDEPVTVTFSNQ